MSLGRAFRLDFRRLPGLVFDLPRRETETNKGNRTRPAAPSGGWMRAHFPEQRLVIEPKGHLDMNDLCDIIKILGVYFGGDAKKGEELNFWKTLESIKKTINLWKWRGLSLIGRIQIVKTFAIRKIMFRTSAIQSPRISWKKLIRSFIILSGTERTK